MISMPHDIFIGIVSTSGHDKDVLSLHTHELCLGEKHHISKLGSSKMQYYINSLGKLMIRGT